VLEKARIRPGRGFKPLRAALYYAQRGIIQPTIRSAITAGLTAAINWRHPSKGGAGRRDFARAGMLRGLAVT
jgi:hypothetical protein